MNTDLQALIRTAMNDAAQRTGADEGTLKVVSAEAVTWPDGALGCPQPGMLYTQALVPGYRIRIDAGGRVLDYHGGRRGPPVFCPADRVTPPVADPRT